MSTDVRTLLTSFTDYNLMPYSVSQTDISTYFREKELTENYEHNPSDRALEELQEFRQGPYNELGIRIRTLLNISEFIPPREYFENCIIPFAKLRMRILTNLEHNYLTYQMINYFWSLVFKTERTKQISPALSIWTVGYDGENSKIIEDPYVIECFNDFKIKYTNSLAEIIYHSELLRRSNFCSSRCNRVSSEIFETLIKRNTAIIEAAGNDLQKEDFEMVFKANAHAETHGDYYAELYSHQVVTILTPETDSSVPAAAAASGTETTEESIEETD